MKKPTQVTSLLFHALNNGLFGTIELLIKAGADVNIPDKIHQTALHHAVIQGNIKLVDLIIEKGAKINAADQYGQTALHLVENDDIEIAKLLIKNGADVNIPDEAKETPLHCAIRENKIKIAHLLIEKGAKE